MGWVGGKFGRLCMDGSDKILHMEVVVIGKGSDDAGDGSPSI